MFRCSAAMHDIHSYIEALLVREIGYDSAALRTVLTFVASLLAGGPAMIRGSVPTKKGTLQMTSASRQSLRNFCIKNVVSVSLAKSVHELPRVAYAGSCTLVLYDNDVNPGLHCHEADGTVLNVHAITGSAHSGIIQCLKSTKPQAGFDQDVARFEELAGAPTPDATAREASEAEPPQEDGLLPTICEE
eukprot:6207931-Pyramimonas_sp.AAC.1